MQYKIDIDGENETACAIIRRRDGVVIGKVFREYAEELLPYFGQAAPVKLGEPTESESDEDESGGVVE